MEDKTTEYGGVSLPIDLIERIDKEVEKNKLGIRSRAEYVAYIVRKELQSNGFGGSP